MLDNEGIVNMNKNERMTFKSKDGLLFSLSLLFLLSFNILPLTFVTASERDWDQFHSPKNLSMALAAEVAELLEICIHSTECFRPICYVPTDPSKYP